nr:hypothetical protein [Tanacetum cinerariifolium]
MAQKVILAAQLVPRFHRIGRCNNYAVVQSIPCSPECKIIWQILLDHPLNYALTATADVHVVYLQQFWRTISKWICSEIFFIFLWKLLKNLFVAPVNIETIEAFMNKVGYQCVVDKTKINILQLFHVVINQTNVDYAALLWWDFMNNIPQRIEEDYHSIKDDIPLVSVYTTGDVRVRGMMIPNAFLTEEIRATDDFKEYKTVFMTVDVLMNHSQLVVSTQGTHRQQKVVEGNKDDDDSEDRFEPESHKDKPEYVNDDDDKGAGRDDDIHSHHDDHQEDDAPPGGRKE